MLTFALTAHAAFGPDFCGYWEKLSVATSRGHDLTPFLNREVGLGDMERSYPNVRVEKRNFHKVKERIMGSAFTTQDGERQTIGEFLEKSTCPKCKGKECNAGPVGFLKVGKRWGISAILLERPAYRYVIEMCRKGKLECTFESGNVSH